MDPQFQNFNKDSFFDYERITQNHNFEIGFQILNEEVPDTNSDISCPPAEHYDKIISAYNTNSNNLNKLLIDFSTYLYKNGFDDVEEFNKTRMEEILINLCKSNNAGISQSAFHIITLLQSKGPAFPIFCLGVEFFNFCTSFLDQEYSPVLYYSLSAINNLCCQNEETRNDSYSIIPPTMIKNFFQHFDVNVKEVALDLACTYLKYPLSTEDCFLFLELAKEALITQEKIYYRSGFWILVRILRNCPELTDKVMDDEILECANDIFDDKDSDCIIPGLIFISYVYEMNFEIPDFYYNGILDVLADPPSHICQKQAYRTIAKIMYRRPDLISKFLHYGIIGQASYAIENAKFNDKIQIGLIVCEAVLSNISESCDRILQTKSISFFLDLLELEDDELTKRALACMINIFNEAESIDRVDELLKRFIQNDGLIAISKLEHEEDNEISLMAADFKSNFFSENE